jgi:G3E family GTPase
MNVNLKSRIPVHVLTGFLGSGKTTFLNALLRNPGFDRTAVVINEFGEVGLDHLFIEGREDGVFELANGCLCCTIRGELANTLIGLPLDRIDRVIVETTGLADPVPVLQAIMSAPVVSEFFEASGVIALADALNFSGQTRDHREARMQIALADRILVTKLDMLDPGERKRRFTKVSSTLRHLNPVATIEESDAVRLSTAVMDDLALPSVQTLQKKTADAGTSHAGHDHHAHGHDANRHDERIRATVLKASASIPRRAIDLFCELMTTAHAQSLLRLKGIVSVEGEAGPLVLHAIHGVMHEPRQMDAWPDGRAETRIVVIVRDLDPEFVQRLFAGFANFTLPDTADRQALLHNPLAIPGYSNG